MARHRRRHVPTAVRRTSGVLVLWGATVAPYAFAALSDAFGFTGAALIAAALAPAAAGAMSGGALASRRQ